MYITVCAYMESDQDHCCLLTETLVLINWAEVLRPSQPIRVMSSMVNLPNLTFSWAGLVPSGIKQYLCTFFLQNRQLPFLKQQKGENDCKKYFMINLYERMLPDLAGSEHASSWSPTGCPIRMSHRHCTFKWQQKVNVLINCILVHARQVKVHVLKVIILHSSTVLQ